MVKPYFFNSHNIFGKIPILVSLKRRRDMETAVISISVWFFGNNSQVHYRDTITD